MESEEFLLVGELLRSFATRYRIGSADEVKPAARTAAQEALAELGLAKLRRTALPVATVQECALLAEEHGSRPLTTSLIGTVLLAPELLRLLGDDQGDGADDGEGEASGALTIALAPDLRFPGPAPVHLVAWDCEGADGALCVDAEGTVTRAALGPPAPNADLLRSVRTALPGPVVGRLDPDRLQRWQAYALVVVASELVGAARAFVEASVDYARERRQYGQPIGAFQAVQHLLADATVLVEACTSATRYAAWCLDHEPPGRALTAARVAKAEVNVSAVEAVYAGMQVFGGIAQTWEHRAHLYLRRVLLGATVLASTADLLPVLAEPEDDSTGEATNEPEAVR
ncbi:acyl-CoA dehydrogenase family protein [Streptomyces sp. NBC_01275]|uniref:acyl-CoA dehydrogenase family protein n=1 Tax=Streptomyces sp. NBC_01275 TaxID=2903807 RepID=UPI002254FE02|nr:acyl-CoA dehydrogenase family protein [Streptomyces sp. NBC_01275]MCX4766549.1 acyl-CoA dehydrogenase family protein [Streptomyces sp. NBC_01275]